MSKSVYATPESIAASELDRPRSGVRRLSAVRMHDNEFPDVEALLALLERPAWQADAACREHPEISWFPASGDDTGPAKRVCARCLVRSECGQWALARGADLGGVWGGLGQRDRRRLLRQGAPTRRASSPPLLAAAANLG